MRFVLIDANSLVHRMKHVIKHYESFEECVAMILHNVFMALQRSYEQFGAQHLVACFDSYSWRKEYFPPYKADRDTERALWSPSKIEQEEILRQVLREVRVFLQDFTNVTVLSEAGMEADDFIARWVTLHHDPALSHIIVSADGDFKQLVTKNVHLYDPLFHRLFLPEGVFIQDGKPFQKDTEYIERYGQKWKVLYDKKTAQPVRTEGDWALFEKCIRGRKNNLRAAYPRVATKKLRRAFEDKGGVEWNNVLNHIWGPDDERQSVRKRYEFNRLMLDLTRQPQEIKDRMDEVIYREITKPPARMIGMYLRKFAGKYRLDGVLSYADSIVHLLSRRYDD